MPPSTAWEWIAVANERAADAVAMLPTRGRSAGPVYMVGYAIECTLKAYLQQSGIGFPRSGREGHSLKTLWAAAGFRRADLRDERGEKTFFFEAWKTDLRYSADFREPPSVEALVLAARTVTGWLQTQVRRAHRRR